MRRCQIPFLAVAQVCVGSLSAQVDATPSYRTSQLECSQFVETSHNTITTQTGRRSREQTAGRRGVWRFRVQPGKSALVLEGWLDTLVLWRRSPETTIRPDTDGRS